MSVRDVDDMVSGVASNLNIGDTASECERAFSYAKEGCEVILDKSQDLDGKLFETLTKVHGLHVVEALDDVTVVLALPTDDDILIKSVRVDAVPCPSEDDSRSNYKGAAIGVLPGVDFKWSSDDIPVKGEGTLPIGNQDQKVWAEFFFKTAHGREGDSQVARLVLMEYSFGVDDYFDDNVDKLKRGWFVYKVTTGATPSGTWQEKCDKLIAHPTSKAKDVTYEEASTVGVGSAFSASAPVSVMMQRQDKRAVTAKEYEWKPCRFTGKPTRSVTWTWEMLSWKDGKSFKLDKPFSFAFGALPNLPYDPRGFAQDSSDFVADARWRIPHMSEEDLGSVGWDIEVRLHLAFVKEGWQLGPLKFCPKPKKMEFTINAPSVKLLCDATTVVM